MGIISAGLTHIGMKRKTNQDAIYVNGKKHLYVVADGMGGHNGGDIASSIAVNSIPQFFFNQTLETEEEVKKSLEESVFFTNRAILSEADKNEELKGMGTTVVGMYFFKNKVFISNVGDSRAYLISHNQLFQITRDHSLVQEKINMGIYSREQAAQDMMKNVLVRTVGYGELEEVDIFSYKVHKNDLFLICSDGLHSKVSDKDILTLINRRIPEPANATKEDVQSLVQDLIDQANRNGGNDNISIIICCAK